MDERYQTVVVLVHVWVDINKERVLRLGQRSGVCVSRQIFRVVVRCTALPLHLFSCHSCSSQLKKTEFSNSVFWFIDT